MRRFVAVVMAGLVSACVSAGTTRVSKNSIIVDAGAAPICGSAGAAKAAERMAAIETIRAGYERYVIVGSQAENNVSVSRGPGSFNTTGTMWTNGNYGTYASSTTYTPGPTIVSGSHDRSLGVVMLNRGDAGFEQGLDAREMLGPKWQELVKSGIHSCFG